MSKSQTKRNVAIPAVSRKKQRTKTDAPGARAPKRAAAPAQTSPPLRRQTGRTVDAAQPNTPTRVQPAAPPRSTKQAMIATMLRQRDGAAIAELMTATGWQSHSIRAALTGLRKAGHQIKRQRDSAGATRYRLVSAA